MPGLNLTHQEAIERAQVVKPSKYQIHLDLTGDDKVFRSKTRLEFSGRPGANTFADLVAEKVYSIKLNGQELGKQAYRDSRIELNNLAASNVLEVEADCLYMHTGEGLHRSVDPSDGEVYLYTQFEVPDARRVYATFEQPDLKATFQFTVVAPANWQVFSNTPTPIPTIEGNQATFVFPESEVMSTYVTAICAGPFVGEVDEVRSIDGRVIPLGAYCRKSLLDHLEAADLFQVTKQGFAFFEDAYGVPYPFSKYDQIFVPEFNAGAMENAGLVTFRDQYLPRSKPTAADLEHRTTTTLHELAHMWFGDLVTMKWWDDLWLNESFAEFMSYLATAEATQWKDAWLSFVTRKEWGMAQDQKPTTHPIVANIRDLEDVEVNFDGITYAKGGAALRQLVEYVGRDNFFQAINRYLHKYAQANATLADLLAELEETSGRDLAAWSKVWLQESGVTILRPEIQVDDAGIVTQLDVVQEVFSAGASLRPHRLRVSGFKVSAAETAADDAIASAGTGAIDSDSSASATGSAENSSPASTPAQNSSVTLTKVFSIDMDVVGARTPVPQAIGLARPDLVLVNDHDLTYAKVRLDQVSLATATSNLSAIADPLTRKTIVSAAWDMTCDGEMSATQFVRLSVQALACETNAITVQGILRNAQKAATHFAAPSNRPAVLEFLADAIHRLILTAPAGSDLQKILVRHLATFAVSTKQVDLLEKLYWSAADKTTTDRTSNKAVGEATKAPDTTSPADILPGLVVDPDLKWSLLIALVKAGRLGESEIARVEEADPSLTGAQRAARARASLASPAAREATWNAVMHDQSIPNDTRWQMALGFWAHAALKPQAYAQYVQRFYDKLANLWSEFTFHIASRLVTYMEPSLLSGYVEDADPAQSAAQWLTTHVEQPDALRRLVLECQADAERMMQAQTVDAANSFGNH